MNDIAQILEFLKLAERLKYELRHSWLSNGRRESVAEHTWQMALMAVLLHRKLTTPVDLEKTLKMILVHDLVEALAGDVPVFEKSERQNLKSERERKAIEEIYNRLPEDAGGEIRQLWLEFDEAQSGEAKFAQALDHLEVQIQHNLAALDTWQPIEHRLVFTKMQPHCEYDPFLKEFCMDIVRASEEKLKNGGVDLEAIRKEIRP